jgi:hypothetical protein
MVAALRSVVQCSECDHPTIVLIWACLSLREERHNSACGLVASQPWIRIYRFIPHDIRVILSESVVVTFSYSMKASRTGRPTSIERSPAIVLVFFHATGSTVKKGATELFWPRVSLPVIPPVGSSATMPQARHMVDLIYSIAGRTRRTHSLYDL